MDGNGAFQIDIELTNSGTNANQSLDYTIIAEQRVAYDELHSRAGGAIMNEEDH